MPPKRTLPPSASVTLPTHVDTQHSDHADFSESTDEIAPLTEEEKKARLEDLRKKLMEKRANQSVAEKEEAKRNEVRWSTLLYRQLLTMPLANSPESH